MKIRLSDRTCVCFLTAEEAVVEKLRNRCIEQVLLLAINPLYLLFFILEERTDNYMLWLAELFTRAYEVEAITDMVPPQWKLAVQEDKKSQLADFDELLKELYSVNTELSHFKTVMKFALKFGKFCLQTIDDIEDLRDELGLDILKMQHRSQLTDCIRFVHNRNEVKQDKLDEVLSRLGRQINVVRS